MTEFQAAGLGAVLGFIVTTGVAVCEVLRGRVFSLPGEVFTTLLVGLMGAIGGGSLALGIFWAMQEWGP